MRSPALVLAVAQPECAALDVAANAEAHAEAIRAAGARVVVFPELSLTGYEMTAPLVDPADPRLAPMVAACRETNTVALAGAPVAGPYIATLLVDGSGVSVAYRKQYPHTGEERFRPGPSPAVVEVDGWRIGLAICRDTGVEQHAADTAAQGVDVYAAGVVGAPADDQVYAERARRTATTHHVWVAFASFAGPTGSGYPETAGHSAVWSPSGTLIDRAGPDPGDIARARITPTS